VKLPTNEGSDYEPCPVGNHVANCIRFVDLGTQATNYLGKEKLQRKVLITWELCDEHREDGEPYTVSKRYTWSTYELATLRKDLESWRGKKFADTDFGPDGFDIRNILGKPCLLNVNHDTHDGKTYANVVAITPVPRGINPPLPKSLTHYFGMDEKPDMEVFALLGEAIQATIRKSPEFATWFVGDASPEDDMVAVDPADYSDIPF